MPTAMPNSAVMIGSPMATTEPKAISMISMAAVIADPLAGPGRGRDRPSRSVPTAQCDRVARPVGLLRPTSMTLVTAAFGSTVAVVLVELHHCEGDVAVPGDLWPARRPLRRRTRRDVGQPREAGPPGHRRWRSGWPPSRSGRWSNHHVGTASRPSREPGGSRSLGPVARRVPGRELVLEAAAHRLGRPR